MTSVAKLGKRKERETGEAGDDHNSTIFISNLPYTATSTDLQTLFSDIAPVRTAFVVTEPGTGVSKGVGYVSFALKEDAESCLENINKEGIKLAGRAIRGSWADKKIRIKETPEERDARRAAKSKPAQPGAHKSSAAKTPFDPLAIKTIIISGLPTPLDKGTLWKKIRKCQGAEKLEYPALGDDGKENDSVAHVVFATPAAAGTAVSKLHAHVYKGAILSVTLKRRLQNLQKVKTVVKAAAPTQDGEEADEKPAAETKIIAPSRASRLIVRNLPFDVTEQDLRAVFLPYGPIHTIDIPQVPTEEGSSKMRSKGFAFVWFLSQGDAASALEKTNGKKVRAGMAKDMLESKKKKKKDLRLERKSRLGVKKEEGAEDAAGDGDVEMADAEVGDDVDEEKPEVKLPQERVIAVDWALSKEKWKAEVAKAEAEAEAEGSGSSSESGSDDESGNDEESDSGSESEGEDGLGVHGEESSGSEPETDWSSDEDDMDVDRDDVPVKPTLPPPESGTTLFVRNVSFDSVEEDLRVLFRAFGPLRYARLTMDPATGRSRGTGFVCFWNKEDADKVIEMSEQVKADLGTTAAQPKKNPFSLPSLLTADPSSSLARSLVLNGRTLDVVRAVTRETATKLREEGEKMREKTDKRNTYLLREGVIFPNSPEAKTCPPAELERRQNSYASRKALLKSNPSLYISRTRLSVRQLPINATERMVKRLAVHAKREYEREVKEGKRPALTADERAERTEDTLNEIIRKDVDEQEGKTNKKEKEKEGAKDAKGKGKKLGRDTGVKQTKIVRQADRVDPLTLKGRSKGYGFLEMTKHADALRVLRWANNNPAVAPLMEGWWRDELSDILKRERAYLKTAKENGEAKEKIEEREERIKRLRDEVERKGGKKEGGRGERLIVEFSIENVQVVQRRTQLAAERGTRGRDKGEKGESKSTKPERPRGAKRDRDNCEKRDKKGGASARGKQARGDDDAASERPAKRARRSDAGDKPQGRSPSKPARGGKDAKATKGSTESKASAKEGGEVKNFNPVGSMIGRKRKERRNKK